MSIYLIRHTAPLIDKGTCYGQADIDVKESFYDEAAIIKTAMPVELQKVWSSPLQRCRKLAEHLFPAHPINLEHKLKEINCGEWELQKWDDIPSHIIDPWMEDYVNVRIPGGENYLDLYDRVVDAFLNIASGETPAAIVTHGGVIRSILAHITGTPLLDSFKAFSIYYGCVIRVSRNGDGFVHEVLSNIPTAKEQHKPSPK
ncbi:alpha-ribazole phosphatase [Pseudoflavitalea rhizosphaerae]|uniref:alpha-ribazole phosphatase n=1 Tax=Pseudoflavitalea rhizosphaerae TaxID=1884793 RepID=UPI000F8DA7EE|nr:alpha-ribazole phosphatase [Pseudoflavitalea rhizosphaerae]